MTFPGTEYLRDPQPENRRGSFLRNKKEQNALFLCSRVVYFLVLMIILFAGVIHHGRYQGIYNL